MKIPLLTGAAALLLNLSGLAICHAQSPAPSATPLATPVAAASASPSATAEPVHVSKRMLAKYDTNKDGVLDATEMAAFEKDRAARHAERLRKYDKNGDGKLDDEERAAMRADLDKEKVKDQEK